MRERVREREREIERESEKERERVRERETLRWTDGSGNRPQGREATRRDTSSVHLDRGGGGGGWARGTIP